MEKEFNFQKGYVYIVKALDHFTRHNDNIEQLFIEFLGMYVEETEYYHKFCSYYYEEHTTEVKFYSPEFRFIVKNTIWEVKDLHFKAVENKFEEIIMDSKEKIII